MDMSKSFAISALTLMVIGSAVCFPQKTRPAGIGILAGGITYAFFALLTLLL